jgi:uncharacterized repeat protein (TIGR04042 family)
MPEMSFRLLWPDASETVNYSPSSVIATYFVVGGEYELPVFLDTARRAMQAASDRVAEKYGFACARAGATLNAIEQQAVQFAAEPGAKIKILEIS